MSARVRRSSLIRLALTPFPRFDSNRSTASPYLSTGQYPTVGEACLIPPSFNSPTALTVRPDADAGLHLPTQIHSSPTHPLVTHDTKRKEFSMRDFHTPTATQGRYVGPDAWQIAGRLPHRVRFERGWFHTAAVCHGSLDDRLSFRQRPDGGAIDVRCHSADCARQRIIRRLEELTGESILSAYEQGDTVPPANEPLTTGQRRRGWIDLRLLVVGALIAMLVAPLAFGYGVEVVALNAFGLGWAAALIWRIRQALQQRRHHRRRARGGAS